MLNDYGDKVNLFEGALLLPDIHSANVFSDIMLWRFEYME